MLLPPALLACGALFALHVDDTQGVDADTERAIIAVFRSAIVPADEPGTSWVEVGHEVRDCASHEVCASEIRRLTQAEDVLFLRVIGIPSTIRLIAERIGKGGISAHRTQIDLLRKEPLTEAALAPMVAELFPDRAVKTPPVSAEARPDARPEADEPKAAEPKPETQKPHLEVRPEARPEVVATTPPSPEAQKTRILPWAVLGGSALALGTGIVCGIVNHSAVNEGEATRDPMRASMLQDRVLATGLAADIAYALAAAGALVGVLMLTVD